jgi:2-dehydropantoate 2-reductase
MSERLLVWGAGAIGGSVAAWLSRAGHDVTVVDTNEAHVEAINRDGLRIVGPVDQFTARLAACTPQMLAGRWPVVLLAVKAQATETACRQIAAHLDHDGCVVSLQNGLCETTIARELGAGRTVGALVGFAGDWLSPGEIRFGQRAKFAIGELDGRMSPRLERLAAMLADFEPEVEPTADILGYLWGKLGFTALIFGTALGNATIADQFASPTLLPAWRALAGEVVAVARAEGITPRGFDGFDPAAFAPGTGEAGARASMQAMAQQLKAGAKTHSGPWRDIAVHGRRTEIAEQIGPVIEAGARRGIDTPVLRALVAMIQSLERGERSQSDELVADIARFASQTHHATAA